MKYQIRIIYNETFLVYANISKYVIFFYYHLVGIFDLEYDK